MTDREAGVREREGVLERIEYGWLLDSLIEEPGDVDLFKTRERLVAHDAALRARVEELREVLEELHDQSMSYMTCSVQKVPGAAFGLKQAQRRARRALDLEGE